MRSIPFIPFLIDAGLRWETAIPQLFCSSIFWTHWTGYIYVKEWMYNELKWKKMCNLYGLSSVWMGNCPQFSYPPNYICCRYFAPVHHLNHPGVARSDYISFFFEQKQILNNNLCHHPLINLIHINNIDDTYSFR